VEETAISPPDRAKEALLMGLRLREGVDLHRIADLACREVGQVVDLAVIDRLQQHDLLAVQGKSLRVTSAGMLLLDRILSEIIV
jgi:oxygen-independent coproporphyrinogen-3 oxidase